MSSSERSETSVVAAGGRGHDNPSAAATTSHGRRPQQPQVTGHRALRLAAGTAALVGLVAFVVPHGSVPLIHRFTQFIDPTLTAAPTPGCQTDPVKVSYAATYSKPSGPFVVSQAAVSGLDSACYGATLTVALQHNGTTITGATSSAMVTSASVPVSFNQSPATPPPASQVNGVSLALVGQSANGNLEVTNGQTYNCTGLIINGNVTVDPGGSFVGTYCTVTGNLISAGLSVSLTDSAVNGNLQTSAGRLTVAGGSTVGNNLQADGGGPVQVSSTTVNGNLHLQSLTSPSAGSVCTTQVKGNLSYQNGSEPMQFGGSTTCPGNSAGGNFQVQSNSGTLTIGSGAATPSGAPSTGNTASGNLQVQSNTTSSTSKLGGNWAGGNCTLSGNSPVVQVSGANYAAKNDKCLVNG